jgi:hypothetical protein
MLLFQGVQDISCVQVGLSKSRLKRGSNQWLQYISSRSLSITRQCRNTAIMAGMTYTSFIATGTNRTETPGRLWPQIGTGA